MHHLTATLLTIGFTMLSFTVAAAEHGPTFDIDVEAVFAKAGCNSGACHGNQNGKGGFRLSLRGQDPRVDYDAVVNFGGGRRIDRLQPDESLLLKKPTMEIAHQGGQRFERDTELYATLREWIDQGAAPPHGDQQLVGLTVEAAQHICFDPQTHVDLSVTAAFADGSRRDVTRWAVYEASNLNVSVSETGRVRREAYGEATVVVRYLQQQTPIALAFLPARADFRWQGPRPRNVVDHFVFTKLRSFRRNPAADCADHVFLRRASFDLLGLPPTAKEARQFVGNVASNKREALIDALLARPEFAEHWALKWADLLRVEEKVLDERGVSVFHEWIRHSFAAGRPLNAFVADLLLARGSTYANPPANYFRALRQPQERGEAAARVFLGTRLQCAQCHNHPFDRWTQDDYYAWAAVFARIDYEIIENNRPDELDKNQFKGEQLVRITQSGEVTHPASGQTMAPRFLGADSAVSQEAERLEALAEWLTAADNRQFARSQANRIWFHLMGQGLVEPVDDFRITNPPTHPELLEALADEFIASGFDVRHIVRLIMQSHTYQLEGRVADDLQDYSQVPARRLSAEQLLDAQSCALDVAPLFNGHPLGTRAGQLPGVHAVRSRQQAPSAADRFLFAFGKPERLMTCECERTDATTLAQALLLVNGPCIEHMLTDESNLIARLIAAERSMDSMLEELYWATLSRPPTTAELHHCHSILAGSASRRRGLEDVAWALLNAKEFVFRQ